MSHLNYRGVPYEIRDSYAGFPGFYRAIVGKFDAGNRGIINAESFEKMAAEIDGYLESEEKRLRGRENDAQQK